MKENEKPKLIKRDEITWKDSIEIISSAQKFILPIPKFESGGESLNYPDGHEKAGQPITDWQGNPIGDEGVVFYNYKDECVQAVKSDGTGVIIFNLVIREKAEKLCDKIKSFNKSLDKFSLEEIKEILEYANKELELGDRYNSDIRFIREKMIPIQLTTYLNYGLYNRKTDVCHAIYVSGSGEFQGPAVTPQKFDNGAIILKQDNDIRLIQPDEFKQSYTHINGEKIEISAFANATIHKVIEELGNYVFRAAALHGDTKILDYIWEKAGPFRGIRRAMLKTNGCIAFEMAVENNHIKILDSLWEKAGLFRGTQCAMLKTSNYIAFELAVQNRNTDVLSFLLKKAESLENARHEMLRHGNNLAFQTAAMYGYADVLNFLLRRAESFKGAQYAMLKDNDCIAFRLAAQSGDNKALNCFLNAAKQLDIQCEMLKANKYEALAFIIKNPKNAPFLEEFESFIDKELIINSSFMQEITIDEWCECLKAAKNSGGNKMVDFVQQNLIDPLKLDERAKRAIRRFCQKLTKEKERDLSEPQPGPSSEYEPLPKRPRIESREAEEKEQHIIGEASSIQETHLGDATITHQPGIRSVGR